MKGQIIMNVNVQLTEAINAIAALGEPVVSEVITELDLKQADSDFTMMVITKLVNSLRVDLGTTEMKAFLKDLRKSIK